MNDLIGSPDWIRREKLHRQDHPWGTLYANAAALKKLPRINPLRAQSIANEIVLLCPVEGTINLHGIENRAVIGGNPTKTARINLNFWGRNSRFVFGPRSTSNGMAAEFIDEESLTIGDDCMLAGDIVFRTNDMHAILDASGAIINAARPIVVDDHVWIGQRCTILKGVTIGAGCVVGSGAVVTKSVPPASAIGGNPARVLRSDIAWTRSASPGAGDVAAALAHLPKTPAD